MLLWKDMMERNYEKALRGYIKKGKVRDKSMDHMNYICVRKRRWYVRVKHEELILRHV